MARKQQFMRALSRHPKINAVLYVEPPFGFFWLFTRPRAERCREEFIRRAQRALSFRIELLDERLSLFTPLFFIPGSSRSQWIYNLNLRLATLILRRRLKLAPEEKIILWLYHPFDYPLLEYLHPRARTVFDWAEDWAAYFTELPQRRRQEVSRCEERIMRSVDTVLLVPNPLLQERAVSLNRRTFVVADGTDPAVFNTGLSAPPELDSIPAPRIGYFGTVSKRFDTRLLETLSREMPDCSFLVVGTILRESRETGRLRQCTNIHFLPAQPYARLGGFAAACKVLIMPYLPEETRSLPTKIFDYLASGKPIVSTALPSLEPYAGLIRTASTPQEFSAQVRAALAQNDPDQETARKACAARNTWQERAEEIIKILEL